VFALASGGCGGGGGGGGYTPSPSRDNEARVNGTWKITVVATSQASTSAFTASTSRVTLQKNSEGRILLSGEGVSTSPYSEGSLKIDFTLGQYGNKSFYMRGVPNSTVSYGTATPNPEGTTGTAEFSVYESQNEVVKYEVFTPTSGSTENMGYTFTDKNGTFYALLYRAE
jgi:hypothetical protein